MFFACIQYLVTQPHVFPRCVGLDPRKYFCPPSSRGQCQQGRGIPPAIPRYQIFFSQHLVFFYSFGDDNAQSTTCGTCDKY